MEFIENLVKVTGLPIYQVGTAVVFVFFVIISFVVSCSSRSPRNSPPSIELGLPLIGLIRTFGKFGENPVGFITEQYKKYGNCFTFPIGFGFNFTFLIGPEAHAAFYDGKDEQLSQNEPYRFMTPIFGKGIVFDAPQHIKSQQLRFIKDSINSRSLKGYAAEIVREAENFFAAWGESGEVDLLDAMADLTINTASRCLLGREVREKFGSNVAKLLHDIDEGISPIAIINPYLPLPAFKRRDAARAKFAEMFSSIIAERRAKQKDATNGTSGAVPVNADLLQSFMDAEYMDGTKLTDDQITGMLLGALFAGQHTSSITSTWLAILVLSKQSIFHRVMAEQKVAVGDDLYANVNRPSSYGLTFDSVGSMSLLHLCMKEVLRMFPPLIMLMRQVKEFKDPETGKPIPLRVGKYEIPVGHYVFASPAVSMNLPEGSKTTGCKADDSVFTKPAEFDPDRYTAGRNEDARPYSYTAFGGGLHACLGEQFGFLQVKTIVSVLLRKFELELVGDVPPPNYRAMVVGPMQPLRVRYKIRTNAYTSPVQHIPVVLPSRR
jgi:sterol 14alpha-demethylase